MPLVFSGDAVVEGRLLAGPIRDLNLIFDPCRVAAVVDVACGAGRVRAAGLTGILCLGGHVVPEGQVDLGADAVAVVVRLSAAPGRADQ